MEDDPTADFLAREQAILGADAALFGNPLDSTVPAHPSPMDDFNDFVTPDINPVQSFDKMSLGNSSPTQQPIDFHSNAMVSTNLFQQNSLNNDFAGEIVPAAPFIPVIEEKSQALMYDNAN